MFPAYASLGMSMLQGWAQRGLTEAQNTVAKAQAEADNTVRQAKNEERGATTALQYALQDINNKRRAKAGGEAFNAAQQSMVRMQDTFANGSIEDQIAMAEHAGAYAANAASAGVGGSSVDAIDATMRLRAARQRFYRERNNGYASYDQLQQIAGIIPQTMDSMDFTSHVAGIDYTITQPNVKPVQGNVFQDVWAWGVKNPDAAGAIQKSATSFFNSTNIL